MRVVVAMSGGVDSSLAAALLKEQGHEVIGMALRLWNYADAEQTRQKQGTDCETPNDQVGTCCSPDDLFDARRIAEQLDIPFYVSSAERDFKKHVVDDFTAAYLNGITPNPCVHCNDTVKFDRLLQLALGLGADALATGHYARKVQLPDGRALLRKAVDSSKDQTYFLFRLEQERLAKVIFPLGEFTKPEVRAMAEARGLPTASKHDSQELCFVSRDGHGAFIEEQGFSAEPGDIVHIDGPVVGRHRGLYHYTVGQRRGLGVAWEEPLYVLGLDMPKNQLVVGPDRLLFRSGLVAQEVTWTAGPPDPSVELKARIRYRGKEVPVRLEALDGARWAVYFASPQRAITPGQAIVFYQDDLILGGGWIVEPLPERSQAEPLAWAV